ncbi:MAG: hypothetical protein MJ082_02495 [Clostridia bacterium]|nr:hypothetical protein [Clostridia bacterium]
MSDTSSKSARIISLFAALIMMFLIFSSALLPVFAEDGDEEEQITIKFNQLKVTANANNILEFKIELSKECEKDLTVYFHTENRSAIAGRDYTEVNSTLIVPAGELTATIAVVALQTAQFGTTDAADNYYAPYFAIVLDRVANDEAVIKPEANTAYGYLRSDITLSITTSNNVTYLSEYLNIQTATHGDVNDIDGGETWKSWDKGMTLNNDTTKNWMYNFLRTGIAKAYATMLVEDFSYESWYTGADAVIIMGNKKYGDVGTCSKNTEGAVAYFKIDPCNPNFGGWADQLNGQGNVIFADGGDPYKSDDDWWKKVDYWGADDKKQLYFYNNTDNWFCSKGKLYYSEFYNIAPVDGALDVCASFYNSADWQDFELIGLTFKMLLLDNDGPTVKSSYLDSSSLVNDGTLRLILKFNEPVQVSTANATVGVKFNGGSTVNYFTYAGGNYSDTLFFELKNASKRVYKSYSYAVECTAMEKILDLAYKVSSTGKVTNNSAPDFYSEDIEITPIHYNTPTVTLTPDNNEWAKFHDVEVEIDGAENCTIYYLWDNNASDVSDIDAYGANSTTLTTLSLSGVNGYRYLHVLAVSPYGLTRTATLSSALKFDNTAPPLTSELLPPDELKTKKFSLAFYDMAGESSTSSGIKSLTMTMKKAGASETVELFNAETGVKAPSIRLMGDGNYTATVYLSLLDLDAEGNPTTVPGDIRYPADETLKKWMESTDRETVTVSFSVKDNCSNVSTSEEYELTFDKRNEFDVDVNIGPNMTPISDLAGVAPLYNIGAGESLNFEISTAETSGKLRLEIVRGDGADLGALTFNGVPIDESGVVTATVADPDSIVLEGLTPGYYSITPYFVMDSLSEELLVTNTIKFYVTANYAERTENYGKIDDGNLVLRNKIYTLETSYYYLGNLGSTVSSHLYGATYDTDKSRYVGGASAPAFSSVAKAREYVTYMEYQDLLLVQLTPSAANFLNAGSGNITYVKADNETAFAEAGQYWIRYKCANWTPDSSSYRWAFYYYGEEDSDPEIDIGSLSNNLRNSINSVVSTICSKVTVSYLVGESGRSSATGAPKLDTSRMHLAREESAVSHSGSTFATPTSFTGDKNLYANTITESDGIARPLATNLMLTVKPSTKLFYHYGVSVAGERWTAVNAKDGMSLARALSASYGIYTILEVDEYGAHKYEVCIDTEAPHLTVKINDQETYVDATASKFSASSFSFVGMSGESDEFAYVAVFNTMGRLLNVYYADDLPGVILKDNNYQVEVGDRSGNTYLFTVRLVSDDLKVSVKINDSNTGVVVTVSDRVLSEIFRYEVYCNNVLISKPFAEKVTYSEAGVYTVYVKDIYGNEYRSGTISFNRTAPEVTWSYMNSNGTFSAYNPSKIVSMYITEDPSTVGLHYVSTSTLVGFRISNDYEKLFGDCKFEITGLNKDDYNVDITGLGVTIKRLAGWSVKVWYANYPESYETYVCVLDNQAPSIHVEYIGTSYTVNERDELLANHKDIPSSLTYKANESTITDVSRDGALLSSRYITIRAEDNFGIRSVAVTRNGKPVTGQAEDGSYQVSEYGTYVVTATDVFGNVSTYTFTNTDIPTAYFSIDGGEMQMGSLSTVLLGNREFVAEMTRDGEIELLVHGADPDEDEYFRYRIQNGLLFAGHYELVTSAEGEDVMVVYDADPSAVFSTDLIEKEVLLTKKDGYSIFAKFNEDRTAAFRISCDEGAVDFEVRANYGAGIRPDYCHATLSRLGADIEILAGGNPVATNRSGDVIYLSGEISIPAIHNDKIVNVYEAFSADLNFKSFSLLYEDGQMAPLTLDYSQKGFYCFRITDVYGITVEYVLCYSDLATVLITASYLDGTETSYNGSYPATIRSNSQIRIEVFGKQASFPVNGEAYETTEMRDRMAATFEEVGIYNVKVTDVTGVESEFRLEIGTDATFKAGTAWIDGFSAASVLAGEIYSNHTLSVLTDSDVKKIVIRANGEELTVYDLLAADFENKAENLRDCIGLFGDGEYGIYFYDAYGDVSVVKVHYLSSSALKLHRVTAYTGVSEEYPIELALSIGFYSSNALSFSTLAEKYQFTVNGEVVSLDMPKTYEFHSASGNGSFEYVITYSDIYGFSYEFTACLLMQTIEIGTDSMNTVDLKGKLYTKGNVSITFPADCTALVSYNDMEEEEYLSGTVLRKDGTYRFTVVDRAGNVSRYTISRDSIVEYTFSSSEKDQVIRNGYAINAASVTFRTDANEYVEYTGVFLNGKEMKDYNSRNFTETGLWEILLKDEVGNVSYFSFYLLNHSLSTFSYTAPKDYTVTEVWWSDSSNNRRLTTQKGEQILLTEDGNYVVIMVSTVSNIAVNFTVTIDTKAPAVSLVGCTNGEETSRDVTLTGLSVGDTIDVYVDGVWKSTSRIESKSDVPTFVEPGHYRVLVRNPAGVEVEFSFTHKYVANGATSALIIIACAAVIVGIFIGLLFRNRSKYDN